MSEAAPQTLVKAWTSARRRLEEARIESPVIDARLLLEAAAGVSRTDIVTDPYREIAPDQAATLDDYLARRIAREPVSHILGRKGFWKILLNVNRDVLTPRPDSEVIVDLVLKSIPEGRTFDILDLGVGSGAIILAILAERPAARGVGIELSPEALAVARENAANLGLDGRIALLRGDWTSGLADESFDVVVANPPYIRSAEIETLEPEVKDYEPRLALDGGADGLDAYRVLVDQILRVLRPGGVFHVEIGHDQSADVEALFKAAGALMVETTRDLADKDRVVSGVKKALGN
ncbi:MAG: peptide chain release factor N(5)-glutamine methyltransferase [Caulobacteraceae bacterium]|nr:peptide chain release factor N(5)-glutamine methyltransferase [Caulobacteraceae bacterium]